MCGSGTGCGYGFERPKTEADGCEAIEAPELVVPTILAPPRGTYTGSLHAPAAAATLRPSVSFSAQEEA